MTSNRPEGRSTDVEQIIRESVAETVANTKMRWNARQKAWMFLFAVVIAAGVLYWGERQADRISHEQARFEKATVGNCQSTRDIVNTFDGYLQAQIEIVRNRDNIAQKDKDDLIANYRAHLIRPPDCATLVQS